ncbi:Hypothetical predicted protein [Podarcis lilfordi]|uniref:Uncharacterized protein n=1 Tax=Podarcis lilfordi TaxID=74358 RepID=A0AA35KIL1_9SAUR|nr:Hypothetical predicted protein [Podarcis lilfordi]
MSPSGIPQPFKDEDGHNGLSHGAAEPLDAESGSWSLQSPEGILQALVSAHVLAHRDGYSDLESTQDLRK